MDKYIPDAIDKVGGIEDVGDFITFYQPQSRNRSDKIAMMVLCQTEKKNLSLYLVNKEGARLAPDETLHITH